jgi:DNA-binding beta-propeller fold protein YncE
MAGKTLVILFVTLLTMGVSWGQDAYTRISAKFIFALGTEETALQLDQPRRVRQDHRTGEFYLLDTGHNRVVILNSQGNYLFEFANQDKLQSPIDIAVDDQGRMYILSMLVNGSSIQVFDYNGDYLYPFVIQGGPDSDSLAIGSLVIKDQDRMFLTDELGGRIITCNLSGDYVNEFPIFQDLKDNLRREQMLGAIHLDGDLIYIPLPMLGSVYCYNTQGSLVTVVGQSGAGYGELSFPLAVSTDLNHNVLVLDKHRHTVVSYDSTGRVNGEFGGMGKDPGWFYHPIDIMVDARNRVWVTQGFNNMVQVLQLPAEVESAPSQMESTIVVDE